jgi:hypothetical protein
MGNNATSISNDTPNQSDVRQARHPKTPKASPAKTKGVNPLSCIPSIAQIPLFSDFKIVRSEDG